MDNTLSTELQQRLAELQAIFHAQLPGKIDEIKVSWEELRQNWSNEQLSKLHRMTHSLAGSGGTFGAQEVGQAARNNVSRHLPSQLIAPPLMNYSGCSPCSTPSLQLPSTGILIRPLPPHTKRRSHYRSQTPRRT